VLAVNFAITSAAPSGQHCEWTSFGFRGQRSIDLSVVRACTKSEMPDGIKPNLDNCLLRVSNLF
jgi:hypothetical protein